MTPKELGPLLEQFTLKLVMDNEDDTATKDIVESNFGYPLFKQAVDVLSLFVCINMGLAGKPQPFNKKEDQSYRSLRGSRS